MIAPLAPFAIKGAVWYQGEGNVGLARTYEQQLRMMIHDWRGIFEQGDFPFYIVQLAGFGPLPAEPGGSGWALMREAQAGVARSVPNCGLAVAMDRGEIHNIHPPNKRDVANRLAAVALAKTYGMLVPCEGPTYREMTVEEDHVRISFDHAKGLKSLGSAPTGFAVAGKDQRFVWAQARIDGETIVVWSPKIPEPVAVRYGWGDNVICNLYNHADLPAVPFRSDKW
jgi:sialate O-acetylesterase